MCVGGGELSAAGCKVGGVEQERGVGGWGGGWGSLPAARVVCAGGGQHSIFDTFAHPWSHPPPYVRLPPPPASTTSTTSRRYCSKGDSIVALHRIGNASVIKIVDVK